MRIFSRYSPGTSHESYLFIVTKVYNDTSLETFCTQFPAWAALITHLYGCSDIFTLESSRLQVFIKTKKSFVRVTMNVEGKLILFLLTYTFCAYNVRLT